MTDTIIAPPIATSTDVRECFAKAKQLVSRGLTDAYSAWTGMPANAHGKLANAQSLLETALSQLKEAERELFVGKSTNSLNCTGIRKPLLEHVESIKRQSAALAYALKEARRASEAWLNHEGYKQRQQDMEVTLSLTAEIAFNVFNNFKEAVDARCDQACASIKKNEEGATRQVHAGGPPSRGNYYADLHQCE